MKKKALKYWSHHGCSANNTKKVFTKSTIDHSIFLKLNVICYLQNKNLLDLFMFCGCWMFSVNGFSVVWIITAATEHLPPAGMQNTSINKPTKQLHKYIPITLLKVILTSNFKFKIFVMFLSYFSLILKSLECTRRKMTNCRQCCPLMWFLLEYQSVTNLLKDGNDNIDGC